MSKNIFSKAKKAINNLKVGFITGCADDDPSGISSYSQTGAMFGLSQLWLSLFTFPFMVAIQEMCGRLGLVTGKGLAQLIKENFSKKILYFAVLLLFLANILNIGADLGAMAASMEMVTGGHPIFWMLVLTTLIILLQITMPYQMYAKALKYFGLFLCSYIVTAFLIHEDWQNIWISLITPHIEFTKEYALNIVAILGTTISPYLFFWESSQEVEEAYVKKKIMDVGAGQKPKRVGNVTIRNMGIDTAIGMFFSQAIMFFIIIVTASTLNAQGITDIATAPQAAEALRPFAGDFAYLLFAIGIVGIGLLAIPVLCGSAAYAMCETFGWKYGMNKGIGHAKQFYGVMVVAMLIGMAMNFMHFDAIKALYYSAAFNGLTAPPLMALIVILSASKVIMGKHKNKRWQTNLGWIITALMAIAGVATIGSAFI
ncbi:NRAMP family divalent metal transporter [Pectinatus frisingensis]|uniref:NRAMP family divalent metal transporter n=1 Tax=Pectinatus frisingensis TaxID=865 RepID=UPI0018C844A5|nr:divalent metal cation transporter [Pectinatus frisingensis]